MYSDRTAAHDKARALLTPPRAGNAPFESSSPSSPLPDEAPELADADADDAPDPVALRVVDILLALDADNDGIGDALVESVPTVTVDTDGVPAGDTNVSLVKVDGTARDDVRDATGEPLAPVIPASVKNGEYARWEEPLASVSAVDTKAR